MIYPAEHQGHVERFAAQLRDGVASNGTKTPMQQGMVRKFRLQSMQFEFVAVGVGPAGPRPIDKHRSRRPSKVWMQPSSSTSMETAS